MKMIKIIIAVGLLTAAISIMYSCKKDETTSPANEKAETSAFDPNAIEDMNAYLSNFIKTMKSPTRDGAQMSLEDAEWHLTASLNYQFCNANTGRTDMMYDTIYTTIAVDDDNIAMTELNASFQEISTEVSNIYDSYDMPNKQIVFIHSVIDAENQTEGEATVRSVMATTEKNGHYYFDEFEYMYYQLEVFNNPGGYYWRDAADTLEYYVNLIGTEYMNDDYYYVSINHVTYNYSDYPLNDPTSPYNYRLFFCRYCIDNGTYLNANDMTFYLDSYLGLACNNIYNAGSMIRAEVEDLPNIDSRMMPPETGGPRHSMIVYYGQPISNGQIQD